LDFLGGWELQWLNKQRSAHSGPDGQRNSLNGLNERWLGSMGRKLLTVGLMVRKFPLKVLNEQWMGSVGRKLPLSASTGGD